MATNWNFGEVILTAMENETRRKQQESQFGRQLGENTRQFDTSHSERTREFDVNVAQRREEFNKNYALGERGVAEQEAGGWFRRGEYFNYEKDATAKRQSLARDQYGLQRDYYNLGVGDRNWSRALDQGRADIGTIMSDPNRSYADQVAAMRDVLAKNPRGGALAPLMLGYQSHYLSKAGQEISKPREEQSWEIFGMPGPKTSPYRDVQDPMSLIGGFLSRNVLSRIMPQGSFDLKTRTVEDNPDAKYYKDQSRKLGQAARLLNGEAFLNMGSVEDNLSTLEERSPTNIYDDER